MKHITLTSILAIRILTAAFSPPMQMDFINKNQLKGGIYVDNAFPWSDSLYFSILARQRRPLSSDCQFAA